MNVSPYGVWKSEQGHKLTIGTDSKYEICWNGQCSTGEAKKSKYTYLSVGLKDFLEKEEVKNISSSIFTCLNSASENFASQYKEDGLEFSVLNQEDLEPNAKDHTIKVRLGCELSEEIDFVKTHDFPHSAAQQEIARINGSKEKTEPPKIKKN